jgi:hypothetical protein
MRQKLKIRILLRSVVLRADLIFAGVSDVDESGLNPLIYREIGAVSSLVFD